MTHSDCSTHRLHFYFVRASRVRRSLTLRAISLGMLDGLWTTWLVGCFFNWRPLNDWCLLLLIPSSIEAEGPCFGTHPNEINEHLQATGKSICTPIALQIMTSTVFIVNSLE